MQFTLAPACVAGTLLLLLATADAQIRNEDATSPPPTGLNCDLHRPPAESGVALVGDRVARVHPRRGSISKEYTGCQVVFLSNPGEAYQVAWVIEVAAGDPRRIWSPLRGLEGWLACRYRGGELISGHPEVCPGVQMLPMPSRPAGCSVHAPEQERCALDGR